MIKNQKEIKKRIKVTLTILLILISAACGIISSTNGIGLTNIDTQALNSLIKVLSTLILNVPDVSNIDVINPSLSLSPSSFLSIPSFHTSP